MKKVLLFTALAAALTAGFAQANEKLVVAATPIPHAEILELIKPTLAKLTLARGDQAWSCTFEGPTFTFRGLKLPDGEKLDAVSKFQERMDQLGLFREALLSLFVRFCAERDDAKTWKGTVADLQKWISTRKTRR